MSLVTRCTSCGTLFKVVADQLKISQGWVRCGQCGTVFDAQANLVQPSENTIAASPSPQIPVASPSQPSKFIPPSPATGHPAQATSPRTPNAPDSVIPINTDPGIHVGKLRESQFLASQKQHEHSAWADSSVPSIAFKPSSLLDEADDTAEDLVLKTSAARKTPKTPTLDKPDAPSFIKQAQRAQHWRSPWIRLALSVLSLILFLTLAAQILFHDKDRIAAQWPQAHASIERFCNLTGCVVQPLQKIEFIAVDASSFNLINKNDPQLEAPTQTYRLSISLKNTGSLPLAMAHVELSLQDAQDQVILRRVLAPADLGITSQSLDAAQIVNGSATVQISTNALAGNRIQGYRVLAFYP